MFRLISFFFAFVFLVFCSLRLVVPNVVGMDNDAAAKDLSGKSVALEGKEEEPAQKKEDEWKVINQNPASGAEFDNEETADGRRIRPVQTGRRESYWSNSCCLDIIRKRG